MCGIVGWLGPCGGDVDALRHAVDRMAGTLRHRGPDDDGRWIDGPGGIGLGFRRLSVLDLTPTARQPMRSADGRYVCVFNGEIYNHRDLRAELERRGARFRGASDTEVVVEAAAAFGPAAAVARLWGMFALGIWDRLDGSLLLARDRLGKKPLYVAGLGRAGWLFASELKAFHAVDGFRPETDPRGIAAYLRFGYVPAPLTVFRGTWKMEPGTFSVLRFGRPVRTEGYWDPCGLARAAARAPRTEPAEALVPELDALLRDAVSRRMVADVPVGSLLSGGVDSSAVTAVMQAQSGRPVRTFSVGFHHEEYDEAASAAAVARHLGTDHSDIYVSAGEARGVIPELAEVYDEPFADSSQIPTLLVARLARRDVTVALTGDGGDEVFAGYRRYQRAGVLWAAASRLPRVVRELAGALVTRVPIDWWDSAYALAEPALPATLRHRRFGEGVHKAASLFAGAESADELYWNILSAWPDPGSILPGGGAARVRWESAGLAGEIRDFRSRMTLYDLVGYLPDDILVKVDRATMAESLEARSPLLDHRIVEWAWRLPFGLKSRRGTAKWILRQVLYRYVPAALVDRPKAGFCVPLDHWLRGPLRDWAEDLLCPGRLEAAGLRAGPIRRAWGRHLAGRAEQHRLWVVLMFLQWRDRWA